MLYAVGSRAELLLPEGLWAQLDDDQRDTLITHELAHLRAPDHSPYFWSLVRRYPYAERARGYLLAKGIDE